MTTDKIFKLYDDATRIARESLGRRVTERIQELLKIVKEEEFSRGEVFVHTGMGLCNIDADSYTVRDKESGEVEELDGHDERNSLHLQWALIEPEKRYWTLVATDRALTALKEIAGLCDRLQNEDHFQSHLPVKIFADRTV